MTLFTDTDSCRLLADPEGPAAKRYLHYDAFLDHNHRALRLLSELELLDRGAGLATLSAIRRRTRKLVAEVRGLVASLIGLADNRYQEMQRVFERVAREILSLAEHRRPPVEGPLILPFSDLGPERLPLAGAKSVTLARIKNELALTVPDGFVVTTAAFDLFLRENRLLDAIDEMLADFDPDGADMDENCGRIQESILEAPMPKTLSDALDAAYRDLVVPHGGSPKLAVRSSAVGEDTEASFAGQYVSVLSVSADALESACKTVFASKYSPRAILYRLRYGLTDAATPMAAAVVVMIQAKAAGVLYTVDPSRPSDGLARVDAAPGLGEHVVSGSASPDVYWIDRVGAKIIHRRIQPKAGAAEGSPPEPAVTDATVRSLTESGLILETRFGGPQDIEWAVDETGGIIFLQSRPLGLSVGGAPSRPLSLSGLKPLFSGGQTASPGRVSGKAVHASAGLTPEAVENAILVARTAAPDLAPLMARARGLITDLGGAASHLASVAREFHVPALVDTGEATSKIPAGKDITLLADEGEVYLGRIPELARKPEIRREDDDKGPIGRHLRRILDLVSPLNLTDPDAPEFAPDGCRTLHDLIRFAHEKAMSEMFNLSKLAKSSVVSRKMSANIPLSLHFIDLGGGLAPELTDCDEILPEHIRSRPMAALWRGLAHPGITWTGGVGIDARSFMTLMAGSLGPQNRVPPEVDSYALVSEDYLNLSVKFGYHYSNIDALCSDDSDANAVKLQFSGGAGTRTGKALRIDFLSKVLTRLGYAVDAQGDLLQATLKGLDRSSLETVLDQTGRLLGSSRLLDLAIPNQAEAAALVELFFDGAYDFLGRSETRLPGFYASVGEWSRTDMDGGEVIVQDGSHMTGTISCTLHSAMETVLGGRYRKFLENRHALHYYPVAVKRDSRMSDARVHVELRIDAGCVDLSAGLAFGLTNVGNGMVLAADASAGELQLLEFVNNVRLFRERVATRIPIGDWFRLSATVAGAEIAAALDGRVLMHFTASRPVSGYVGLWSKGDTTVCFRRLATTETETAA